MHIDIQASMRAFDPKGVMGSRQELLGCGPRRKQTARRERMRGVIEKQLARHAPIPSVRNSN